MKETKVTTNKFKKVLRTKSPTTTQLLAMSSNLRDKFDGWVSAEIESMSYTAGNNVLKFVLMIHSMPIMSFDNWADFQSQYFKLMSE